MKVLNFGSCNIDFVYTLDHIVRPGETLAAARLDVFAGGKGLNQSVALARAGAEVYHAGCIGTDGEMLSELLSACGADTTYLKTVEGKCGHAIIQVNSSGENSIFIHSGANGMVERDFADEVLSHFGEGDMLILQNEISNVGYIARRAHERGMIIMLNPSPYNEKLADVDYSMLDYIILNEVEAGEISGMEEREDIISYFKEKYPDLSVMLTLGSRGCVYFDKHVVCSQPAFITDVRDTTAAGDTFTGYFATGIARGESIAATLRVASAAAAISVSRNGAAPSIPEMREVKELMGGMREREDTYKRDRIVRICDKYIDEHTADARLDELARMLGYSTVYAGQVIKDVTGASFSKLVQDKRCSVAHDLLIGTDMSVTEIVRAVGYDNESFFRRKFKERYKMNPHECRKASRGR